MGIVECGAESIGQTVGISDVTWAAAALSQAFGEAARCRRQTWDKFLQQELPGTVAMASRRRGLAPVRIAADRNALVGGLATQNADIPIGDQADPQ